MLNHFRSPLALLRSFLLRSDTSSTEVIWGEKIFVSFCHGLIELAFCLKLRWNDSPGITTDVPSEMLCRTILTLGTLVAGLLANPIDTNQVPGTVSVPITKHPIGKSHLLEPRRGEIGKELCRHHYAVTHEEWIAQVPGEWWKQRYHENADEACRAWRRSLESQRMCGLRINECWEMKERYPSGGPGWLHLRATTCIGPNTVYWENSFQTFAVGAGEDYRPIECAHGWISY